MAVNIGPKIGIDGEAEYRKELQNIIQQTKTLNTEMKTLKGSFDNGKASAKQHKEQIKLLKEQQTALKTETEKLADAVAKSSEKYGENATETLKWKDALAKAQGQLQEVNAELEKNTGIDYFSTKLQNTGSAISNFGSKVTGIGKGITTAVTGPVVAAAAASYAAWSEVDDAMDTIITKTGASGDALTDMQNRAKKIAQTIPTSFGTAAEAVGEVNTRFGLTGDALEALSTQFVKFAEINNLDVTASVDSVQSALTAFGLGAEDASGLLDRLTSVGMASGISIDTLTSGLVSNSAAFQAMGLSIDQAAVLMGQMEVSGADSSAVMTGLSKALKNATDQGIPLDTALQQLQTSITNGTGGMDGLTTAYDLFGAKGAQIYQAVQNGTLDFTNLGTAVSDAGGTVTDTFTALQDPTDSLTTTMNTLKTLGADIVETAAPMLTQVLTTLRDVVVGLKEKWDSLDPSMQENIIKFVGLAAVVGPIITGIGGVISVVGGLVSGIGTLLPVLGTVAGVLTGPVGLAIAGVTAAGVALVANWDKVKAAATAVGSWVSDKWKTMKSAVGVAVTGIKSVISEKLTGAFNTVKTITGNIKNAFSEKLEGAKKVVSGAIDKIKGFFNFKWSLPKLKMPHISISGSFSLMPPSIPKFGIEWYKRAYDNPVMFNSPTVLGTSSGLKGFGDGAGAEVVAGASKLMEMMQVAVQRVIEGGAGTSNTTNMGGVVMNIYGAPGQDVDELADLIEKKLTESAQREVLAWQ